MRGLQSENAIDLNAYDFPDESLRDLSSQSLRLLIQRNLRQALEMTDGTDMNSDVKIDFAQSIIEQARDILLERGEIFTDKEKSEMSFLRWTLSEEEQIAEALRQEETARTGQIRMQARSVVTAEVRGYVSRLVAGQTLSDVDDSILEGLSLGISNVNWRARGSVSNAMASSMRDQLLQLGVVVTYEWIPEDGARAVGDFSFTVNFTKNLKFWELLTNWVKQGVAEVGSVWDHRTLDESIKARCDNGVPCFVSISDLIPGNHQVHLICETGNAAPIAATTAIERGIKPVCDALNEKVGVKTLWSCQGHFTRGRRPFVVFESDQETAFAMDKLLTTAYQDGRLRVWWNITANFREDGSFQYHMCPNDYHMNQNWRYLPFIRRLVDSELRKLAQLFS